ncbi:MAG: hypothetical protein BGN85_00275 [Alphaproteobacteria bacterium 64-11]|nr:MAG: hypothetical protein BGN85_00275 [Alphaproteobacteria bacterium 64-11]
MAFQPVIDSDLKGAVLIFWSAVPIVALLIVAVRKSSRSINREIAIILLDPIEHRLECRDTFTALLRNSFRNRDQYSARKTKIGMPDASFDIFELAHI